MAMNGNASALRVSALTVGYGADPVLTDLSFELPTGAWWALVGANGCGKTTLLDTLAGRRTPLAGEITVAGYSLETQPRRARAALGYALSPDGLPARLTLRECLDLFTGLHGRPAPATEFEELVDAWALHDHLDEFVDRSSLGTRQKLGVLLALVGGPRLLVMDESFIGLDAASGLALRTFLEVRVRSGGLSVLLATHALDLVERHADTALLLDSGAIRARFNREELRSAGGGLDRIIAARL